MSIPGRDSMSPSDVHTVERIHKRFSQFSVPLLVLVGLLTLIIILWLPFGLRRPDNSDTWFFITGLDHGDLSNFFTSSRPLTPIPWMIAYLLDPNSFLGHNLVLIGLLLSKGLLSCAVVYRLLRGQLTIAFLCGVLSIVYPADIGVLWITALNIQFSMVLYLLALYLLLIYWTSNRLWALVGSLIAIIVQIGVYEAGIPFIFVTPFFLLWYDQRFTRRLITVSAAWYIIAGAGFLISIFALRSQAGDYQRSLLVLNDIPVRFLKGIYNVYSQIFHHGLIEAMNLILRVLKGEVAVWFLALAAIAGSVTGFIAHHLQQREIMTPVPYRLGRLVVMCFLFVLPGYMLYIPTKLLGDPQRTLYWSSWAATLVLACGFSVLAELTSKRRLMILIIIFLVQVELTIFTPDLFPAVIGLGIIILCLSSLPKCYAHTMTVSFIVSIGTLFCLDQHAFYYKTGHNQLKELQDIVQQIRQVPSDTLILLTYEGDPDARYSYLGYFGHSSFLATAIRVIYPDSNLQARICSKNTEDCVFTPQGVRVSSMWNSRELYTYDKVIFFIVPPDGKVTLQSEIPLKYRGQINTADYQPELLIDRNAPLPPRMITFLIP